MDHSEIDYGPFEKNFYVEHEDIAKLQPNEVDELRKKLGIRVIFCFLSFEELYIQCTYNTGACIIFFVSNESS